jgi:hypothetical protein
MKSLFFHIVTDSLYCVIPQSIENPELFEKVNIILHVYLLGHSEYEIEVLTA